MRRAIWHKRFLKRLTRCLQLMRPSGQKKIDDISAATFGRRVYEFYLDKSSLDFSNDLANPEQSQVKRMSKTIVKIPTKGDCSSGQWICEDDEDTVKQVKKIRKITHFFD